MSSGSRKEDGKNIEFVQIGVLEAEFDRCRKQLFSELQKAHDRIADLDKVVNEKSDIIVDLKREITEQKDTCAKNIASKEEKLRILSLEVNEKHTKNNELRKENDTLKGEFDKEIKYLQTLNVEHKKNIERLNDHIKKMNIDMKNLSCKHRKETEQLEYDLNETRHAFTCKENEIKVRSTELEYQIDTLETEKRKLGELVKTLNTEVNNLKSTQEQLKQSDESTKEQSTDSKKKNKLRITISEQEDKIKCLEGQNEDAQLQINMFTLSLNGLKEQIRNTDLDTSNRLKEAEHKLNEADQNKNTLQESYRALVEELKTATKDKIEFAERLAEKSEAHAELCSEKLELESEIDKLKKETNKQAISIKEHEKLKKEQELKLEQIKTSHRTRLDEEQQNLKRMKEKTENMAKECIRLKAFENLYHDLSQQYQQLKNRLQMAERRYIKHEETTEALNRQNQIIHEEKLLLRKADNANQHVEDKTFERLNKTCQTDGTYDNPRLSYLTRPTKIAEDYAELYDNEWTDLFECLDLATEEENVSFILNILMKTSAICNDLSNCHAKRIQDAFCKLTSTSQIKRFDPNKEKNNHSDEEETGSTAVEFEEDFGLVSKEEILIESDFGLLQKSQKELIFDAKNFFENELSKEVETTLTKLITGESRQMKIKRQDGLERYIAKCVNTCWSMCQHDPPLFLEFSDIKEFTRFDTNKYKPYTRSGKLIDYIVWPALYLHKGGPLLCKAIAQGKTIH